MANQFTKSKILDNPMQLAIPDEEFLSPLNALHRGENSVIGFLRKSDNSNSGIENLFSATKEEVRAMLPEIAQWLLQDAYFTVNGYNSKAPYKVKETGLPGVWRRERNLRYLNAVYADLDIGRAGESGARGQSVSEASQILIDLLTARTIPQLSMSAKSGRGMYVFWILRDDDNENEPVTFKGQRNFTETLALYKRVNRAIFERLECLAADRLCDAARILRVPGTHHSNTNEKCFYNVAFDSEGKLVTYTLQELAAEFGVEVLAKSLPHSLRQWEPNSNPRNCNRANGPKALAAARARDLVALEQWRGGWKRGRRRFCLRLYAHFLRAAGTEFRDVAVSLGAMASNCEPSYPSDRNDQSLNALLHEVWCEPFPKYKQVNLVRWLGISNEEAEELELEKLVPIEISNLRKTPKGGNRALLKTERRAKISALIKERGMLSERDFVRSLGTLGIVASPSTLHRDLVALGHQNDATRKKSGRKASSQISFPTS